MDYSVCLLARLHGILPGMIKHADKSRYGKESRNVCSRGLWEWDDVKVVVPALAEGQRSTVDKVYRIRGGMKKVGDERVSEGGRERWSDRDGKGGRAGGGRDGGRVTGRENVPDSHGVY